MIAAGDVLPAPERSLQVENRGYTPVDANQGPSPGFRSRSERTIRVDSRPWAVDLQGHPAAIPRTD